MEKPLTPKPASREEEVDLGHFLRVLFRHKLIILGLGLFFTITSSLIASNIENTYTSTATLSINSTQANVTSIEDIYGDGVETISTENLNTQFDALTNRALIEKTIRSMDLLNNSEFVSDKTEEDSTWLKFIKNVTASFSSDTNPSSEFDQVYQKFLLMDSVFNAFISKLNVIPLTNTNLVNISFKAKSPQLASDIVNELSNIYIKNDLEQRLAASRNANEWLTERLQRLRQIVDESELAIQEFLIHEQLIDINGITSLNVQELDLLSRQALIDQRSLAEAEIIYRQAQELKISGIGELLSFPAILNHESMRLVRGNMTQIDQEIAELSKIYGRNHPRIASIEAEKARIQQNLEDQALQVIASVESNYKSIISSEQDMVERVEQSRLDLQDVNLKNLELEDLRRELETNQQLYDIFFTRIRETDEISDFERANITITNPAVPAVSPSSPRRKLIVMASTMFGIMLGSCFALLRDFVDDTLKNPGEIETRLNTPNLGMIPLVEISKEEKNNLAFLGFLNHPHSKFSEAMCTLRTSINLSFLDKPHKVIEITSSIPNEGKTTLSINLAAAMSEDCKVLLVDMDLRRPSLGQSLGLKTPVSGLSDFMTRKAKIKDCIHPVNNAKFYLLPAGELIPNPLALINSKRFRRLLDGLSTKFDCVILDTPPMQAVSDALLISTIADTVIYVVKVSSTPLSTIKPELVRLRQHKANILGVVLNQIDPKKIAAYGYGDYYDGYGYNGYISKNGSNQVPAYGS